MQYSKDASRYKWGFGVTSESSSAQPPLRWFKLLLNQHANTHDSHVPGSQYPDADAHINRKEKLRELLATLAALPKEKTPIDVVTDYLKGIYTHTLDALKNDYPQDFSSMIGREIPLRFFLTVPAVRLEPDKKSNSMGLLTVFSRFGVIVQRNKPSKQLGQQAWMEIMQKFRLFLSQRQ